MSRGLSLIVVMAMLIPLVVGCGTSSSETATSPANLTTTTTTGPATTVVPTTTTAPGTAGSVSATPDTAALEAAVSAVWQAMRDRDQMRMRDFLGDQLRQQMRDQDMQHLMSCIPSGTEVTLASRSMEITGDTAKVRMTFNVNSSNGTPTTIERVWEFARQPDGSWTLSATPTCPVQ